MLTMRRRTTINVEENLIRHARSYAALNGTTLSKVIEDSISKHVPINQGVQFKGDPKEMKIEFISGPTISQLKEK